MKTVAENKTTLKKLAIDERVMDAGLTRQVKETLLNDDFWCQLTCIIRTLEPIAEGIAKLEGDNVFLSSTCMVFRSIEEGYKDSIDRTMPWEVSLPSKDVRAIEDAVDSRKKFLLQPVHYAANLMDPRYRGTHVTELDLVSIILI